MIRLFLNRAVILVSSYINRLGPHPCSKIHWYKCSPTCSGSLKSGSGLDNTKNNLGNYTRTTLKFCQEAGNRRSQRFPERENTRAIPGIDVLNSNNSDCDWGATGHQDLKRKEAGLPRGLEQEKSLGKNWQRRRANGRAVNRFLPAPCLVMTPLRLGLPAGREALPCGSRAPHCKFYVAVFTLGALVGISTLAQWCRGGG